MRAIKEAAGYALAIMSFCSLSGCSRQIAEHDTIRFGDVVVNDNNMFDDICSSVRLIELKADDVVIGDIKRVFRHDAYLYIIDETAESVHIFLDDGRYINTVSKRGHARDEYIQLSDVFVDQKTDELKILSRADKKLLSFSVDGSLFKKTSTLPKTFCAMRQYGSKYAGYMGNYSEDMSEPYNVWLLDSELNILDGHQTIDPDIESGYSSDVCVFSSYGDMLMYKPANENAVYSCDDLDQPHYILDFGKQQDNAQIAKTYWFQEMDRYCLVRLLINGQYVTGVYDKIHKEAKYYHNYCYTGKYFLGSWQMLGVDSEAIYCAIDRQDMYDVWTGTNGYVDFAAEYPEQVKNLRKDFPNMQREGNPFLAIYSIRKD